MRDYLRMLSYKVEEFVSTTPATSLLLQVFSILASLTGTVLALLRIHNAPYIALAVLFATSLFLLLINIRLFDGNKKANESLTKIVDVQRQSYKYLSINRPGSY